MHTQLLTPKAVCERMSISRATLDRRVAAGDFPKPVRITPGRIAFNAAAVEEWIAAKVAA